MAVLESLRVLVNDFVTDPGTVFVATKVFVRIDTEGLGLSDFDRDNVLDGVIRGERVAEGDGERTVWLQSSLVSDGEYVGSLVGVRDPLVGVAG